MYLKMTCRQLDELVKFYSGLSFSNNEILSLLADKHTVVIGIGTLCPCLHAVAPDIRVCCSSIEQARARKNRKYLALPS